MNPRQELEQVLRDRGKLIPIGWHNMFEEMVRATLLAYDEYVSKGVPESKAALVAAIQFGKEDGRYFGY
jgi:hypothetical protein